MFAGRFLRRDEEDPKPGVIPNEENPPAAGIIVIALIVYVLLASGVGLLMSISSIGGYFIGAEAGVAAGLLFALWLPLLDRTSSERINTSIFIIGVKFSAVIMRYLFEQYEGLHEETDLSNTVDSGETVNHTSVPVFINLAVDRLEEVV
jgi:hypothetical protein